MFIKGKFCYLRILKPNDYIKLYNLRSKFNKNKLIHEIPEKKIYQKFFIESQIIGKNFFFGIFAKKKLVGTISIYNLSKDKIAEIGRFICFNQGIIALEAYALTIDFAFKKLKVSKLLGKTDYTNKKAEKLMKYFLFKKYYLNKFETFFDRKYRNIIIFFLDIYNYKLLKIKLKKTFL